MQEESGVKYFKCWEKKKANTSEFCILQKWGIKTFSSKQKLREFIASRGFPGGASGKEPTCQSRRHKRCGFDPWVGRSPGRGQPSPVFLPGESHGQRSLVGYSPRDCKQSDTTELLTLSLPPFILLLFRHRGLKPEMSRCFSPVQFSLSVVSNSLRPHGQQHARPLCPSPTPRVYSGSCLLSWWCHPTISSSVVFFSCLHSCPASRSLPMSQLFTSGGHRIRVSASASVLPLNIQDWFPIVR